MPVNPIESGVGDVFVTAQAALGTPGVAAATTGSRLRLRDGGLRAAKTNAGEEYADGLTWANPVVFTDTIGGAVGSVTSQAQLGTAGRGFAYTAGVDVVTGAPSDYTHTIALGTAQPTLLTFWQKTGVAVGPTKFEWSDAKVSKLAWTCSQDNKVAHQAWDVLALTANTFRDTLPTLADEGTDPLLWTEGAAEYKIDTVSVPEINEETLELDTKLDVHRGDQSKPVCFVGAKGEAMSTFGAIVTDGTLPHLYNALFGTTTPADGTQVSATPTFIAMNSKYVRSAVRSIEIQRPKVEVKPDDFEVYPRAEGGAIPITFGGRCLKSGATAQVTVIAKTGDSASYVTP